MAARDCDVDRRAVVALSQSVYDLLRAFARDLNVVLARGIHQRSTRKANG